MSAPCTDASEREHFNFKGAKRQVNKEVKFIFVSLNSDAVLDKQD